MKKPRTVLQWSDSCTPSHSLRKSPVSPWLVQFKSHINSSKPVTVKQNLQCAPKLYGLCRILCQSCVMGFVGASMGEPERPSHAGRWVFGVGFEVCVEGLAWWGVRFVFFFPPGEGKRIGQGSDRWSTFDTWDFYTLLLNFFLFSLKYRLAWKSVLFLTFAFTSFLSKFIQKIKFLITGSSTLAEGHELPLNVATFYSFRKSQ